MAKRMKKVSGKVFETVQREISATVEVPVKATVEEIEELLRDYALECSDSDWTIINSEGIEVHVNDEE